MEKCSIISLRNIDKIKSIKSEYVIISDKKYDVDYDKIISFMEESNYELYALCPYSDNKSLIKKYDIVDTESGYFNFYLESFIIKKSLLDKCNYNNEYGILMYLYDNVKSYYQSNERIDIDIVYTDKNKNSFYIVPQFGGQFCFFPNRNPLSAIYTPLRINTEPIRATTVIISSITMAEVISVTSGTI